MKLRANHQIVYGKGKVAMPGDFITPVRGDFSNAAEMERLVERGALEVVEEPEPDPQPATPPEPGA